MDEFILFAYKVPPQSKFEHLSTLMISQIC